MGSTLALTGPLAATSTVHKIAGEISVEQINKRNGFLGRPIEWVLLDDQSKPEVARTLYERLITVDKVDLIIGPYATGAILSAMAVAQRYQKVLIHHTFGIPKLAKYPMHFSSSGLAFESEKVVPTKLLDALESTRRSPKSIAIVTSKFPSVHFISAGARDVAAARGVKVVLYLEYEFGNRDFAPIAARIKEADPDFLWVGAIGLDGNLLLDALHTIGYRPRGQYHLFPAPGPLLTAPGAAYAFAYSTFEAHPPMTNNPSAEALCKLFSERAKAAGLPYPFVESQAAGSLNAWLLLEAAVNGARSLDDKAIAAWLKANHVDTPFGRLSFEGENNYGAEHTKVKQNQNGRWVIVWPREFAAPGANIVYPAP
ncbi:MAG: ABC transporter substrate-binding protein [Candidatus Rokuibacteriota bacterium]|nr:MAG: ABC transporter substrate-binding protein [Candidatus Rokubacteria bacterium]